MNKLKIILALVITSLITLSCSSDDNSSKDLNEFEKKLIGTWHTSIQKNDNTYTYYANGTSKYELDITLDERKESDILKGAWKIIDGNILIEYYPDVDESWDNNWQQHPDITSEIKFNENNTILFKDDSPHYKN